MGKSTTQLKIGVGIVHSRRRHVLTLAMGHLQVLTIVLRVLYSVRGGTPKFPEVLQKFIENIRKILKL
jgi:hypothetical protein